MDDIELVPTDDLVRELLHRFDHAVFAGVRIEKTMHIGEVKPGTVMEQEWGDIHTLRRWFGNSFTCSGLCASLSTSILKDFSEREKEIPEGDLDG